MTAFASALPRFTSGLKNLMPRGCAGEACRRRAVLHGVWGKNFGIEFNSAWYCSSECFESGILNEIRNLMAIPMLHAGKPSARMSLTLFLYSRGKITEDQLRKTLDYQSITGARVEEVLIKLGYATQQDVTSAIAAQWGVPVLSLKKRNCDVPVRIPRKFIEEYALLPVHFVPAGRRLFVGFVHGVEHQLLTAIQQVINCDAVPCLITPEDFAQHLGDMSKVNENELVFEEEISLRDMARICRTYAMQVNADFAHLSLCRDYLWARLEGAKASVDLLFHL